MLVQKTFAATAIIASTCLAQTVYELSSSLLNQSTYHFNYATVTGFFMQDDPTTNASTFDFMASNFGLINQAYPTDAQAVGVTTQWDRFLFYLRSLSSQGPAGTKYKLLFLGRHGDGVHNDAEAFYGTPAWDCYYSLRDGNGTVTWADAHLSALGESQALAVHDFWARGIASQGFPTPDVFYTSPLTRCLQTTNLTFAGLSSPRNGPFAPYIRELLREGISGHTCDRRSTQTEIHSGFPSYRFEPDFTETDQLWQPLRAETPLDQDVRTRIELDSISSSNKDLFTSITSHSGEIASILRVIGHREFPLRTGAVLPVILKYSTIQPSIYAVQDPVPEPYEPMCTCNTPPPATATDSNCLLATATVAPPYGGTS